MNNINNFFYPKTIAIVGASDHPDKVGGILMKKAVESKCKIIPINPSHDSLFGKKCYKSISEVKERIDLAVIAIPKDFVINSIKECAEKEIKEVIIVSSGFSEVGDIKSEDNILEIAKKNNIRILGPNCFGIFNPLVNLDLTFSNKTPKKGDIAFISQSGALWSYLADLDFGFSGFVGLGNMADLEFNDFLEYFSNEKETKSIILYIEKLKKGVEFIELCKKINKGKKIYAILAGKSKEGKKATFSHTASLASDYEIYIGAFKQAGVELCSSLGEAVEKITGRKITKAKKVNKIKLNEVSIITNAGGAQALVSDYLSESGVKVVSLNDILGTALSSDYKKALEKTNAKEIIVILTPQSMTDITGVAKVLVDFKNKTGKTIIPLFLGEKSIEESNKIFEENKMIYFNHLLSFKNSL